MSNVLRKVVFITEEGDICSCDGNFYKVCHLRLSGNLPCRESMVRVTAVDRQPKALEEEGPAKVVKSIDEAFDKVENKFKRTLEHLSEFDRL